AAEQLETFERLLYKNGHGILPAKLVKKISAPTDHHFLLHAADSAFQDPPLKAFADDADRVSLRSPRFRQYLQAKLPDNSPARVVHSFMPEIEPNSKTASYNSMAAGEPVLSE